MRRGAATPARLRSSPPVLGGGGSVSLPPVFEPVPDLSRRESGCVRELPLLAWIRVRVLQVPLAQQPPCALLEAVRLLLSVPDGARQRELLPHAVLVHRPERPPPQLLRLPVVRFEPHGLQLAVRGARKAVRLQDVIELAEAPRVVGYHGAGPLHRLVLGDGVAAVCGHRQGPEEAGQPLDVTGLLQRLAHTGDLRRGEAQSRQGQGRTGGGGLLRGLGAGQDGGSIREVRQEETGGCEKVEGRSEHHLDERAEATQEDSVSLTVRAAQV